ncbi:hypothetical protein MTO96_027635 [Rhipicephalus appendiculatus]
MRNLTLSSVGDDNFTLSWQKPEGCIEYYEVQVTDAIEGSTGNRSHGIVSCNNGAVIDYNRTSVTCDQPDTCTNVTITVQPHVSELSDSILNGATLTGILLLGKVPPLATDLQLLDQSTYLVYFSFRVRRECVDNVSAILVPYTDNPNTIVGTCKLDKWEESNNFIRAVCDGICDVATLRVETKRNGPPERVSRMEFPGVEMLAKCRL